MPEQVALALPDTLEAVHPGQKPGILKRLDRLGDRVTGAAGALGDLLVGREAKAAAGVVEAPEQGFKDGKKGAVIAP